MLSISTSLARAREMLVVALALSWRCLLMAFGGRTRGVSGKSYIYDLSLNLVRYGTE